MSIWVAVSAGVAANYEAWGPQLVDLCGTDVPNREGGESDGDGRNGHDWRDLEQAGVSGTGIQACAFDNRGVGQSSMPEDKNQYRLVNSKSPSQVPSPVDLELPINLTSLT